MDINSLKASPLSFSESDINLVKEAEKFYQGPSATDLYSLSGDWPYIAESYKREINPQLNSDSKKV